ncbi:hypothetical protein BDV34DRAFT_210230 [Aspergillus parasiticus]|uniref:Uncharacterized protein n=1 Tax=Aspergillus parasiticus TaxID=5067 RepID=A0A5N6DYQ2_ASPPA|nr:hypothetical protein BDV34DRAFT_210230 [Aspergillus parasiticus]
MSSYSQGLPLDSNHESSANETSVRAIRSFVAALGCDFSRFPLAEDQELLGAAQRAIRRYVTSDRHCRMLLSRLSLGVGVAAHAYSTYPFNVRLLIAIYTSLCAYIDDADPKDIAPKLERFAVNFGSGVSHSDSNLDYLAYLLVIELPKFWGPLAYSCIIKSTLDLLSGCVLEGRFPSGFERQAHEFPSYLRNKTRASEVYAFFIFPESLFSESTSLGLYGHSIPVIIEYKEYVIGNEKNGLIVSEARVQMRQPAKKLGEADEQLQQAYYSFVDGLSAFHILSKRSRLPEIRISITAGFLNCSPE